MTFNREDELSADEIKTIKIHINAIKEMLCNQKRYHEAEDYQHIVNKLDNAIESMKALPSAEPEIIRCKDCKYGDTFREFEDAEMPMKCLGWHYGGTYPDDFCSRAERRTDERSDKQTRRNRSD